MKREASQRLSRDVLIGEAASQNEARQLSPRRRGGWPSAARSGGVWAVAASAQKRAKLHDRPAQGRPGGSHGPHPIRHFFEMTPSPPSWRRPPVPAVPP